MIDRIAEIVRAVRAREPCSLAELAERSDVPLAVLTALDQGRRGITTTQLDDLAHALSLDPTALLNGREVTKAVPSVFLRHAATQDFDPRDGAVFDEALEQGRALASLRSLLGEAPLALQAGVFTQCNASADRPEAPAQDGYRLAREVRRWLGNAGKPLADVATLLEDRFGVAVVVRTLESNRVTAAGVRAERAAVVVLSARDAQRAMNPLLVRVYLSHELCHVLFDPSSGGLHLVVDSDTDPKTNAAEQRARAFAAELLLPLEGLTRLLGTPRGVDETAAAKELVARARSRFGTPHEITANHLCNLGFIDMKLRDWLQAEGSTFAGAAPEMRLPARDSPSRLVGEYVARAHREGFLTDGEARALLELDLLAPLPWDEVAL